MRITRVEIYPLTKIRYQGIWRLSRGVAGGPDMKWGFNVIVRLRTDEGLVGWGEVGPINPYQGETTWSIAVALERFYGPLLIGRDPWDVGSLHVAMEGILPDNPHARTAVDLALYDLMGKASGQPVYKLLGGLQHERVPLKFPVAQAEPEEMVQEACRIVEETGSRYLKVKIGGIERLPKDLVVLAALRRQFGDSVRIQIDANASYQSVHEALSALRRMEEYNPVLIEQPLPRWHVDGMAEIAAALETPLLADESCWSPHDAFKLLKARAADVLNVKIPKAGGLYHSKQIASIAEAAGAQVFVGSTAETGVGGAAGVHFYASTRNMWPVVACLFGTYWLVHDMLTDATRFRLKDGYVEPPSAPGLGIEVDEDALRTYSEDPIIVDG